MTGPLVWRGGGWGGISKKYDRDQRAAAASHVAYLRTLEAQLEQDDQEDLAMQLTHGLEGRIVSPR